MAEVVNEMPVQHSGKSKYQWDAWPDGRVWKLTRGIDFTTTMASFRTAGYEFCKRRGIKVQMTQDGNDVYIQAIKEPADAQ